MGSSDDIVAQYLHFTVDKTGAQVALDNGKSEAYFTSVEVLMSDGTPSTTLPVTEPFWIRFHYIVARPLSGLEVSFTMLSKFGNRVFSSFMSHDPRNRNSMDHSAGRYVAEVEIPALFLAPGTFVVRCGLHQPNIRIFDVKEDVIRLDIVESGSHVYAYAGADVGSVLTRFGWTRTRVDACVEAVG
jgi:hypothetical protein